MHAKYSSLLRSIMTIGVEETNERTGKETRIFPHPASLAIDLRSRRLPLPGNRRVYPGTAAAEVAWFLSGDKDLMLLRELGAARLWEAFVEPGTDKVEGAYGHRWSTHFGRDQISLALEALATDRSDRRCYVSTWDPATDGLGAKGQRSVPCPVGFGVNVIGGQLQMAVVIRSSDVFVGLPYDVMGHSLLADAMATSLGVELGFLHVTLMHAHLYGVHYEMARQSLEKTWNEKPLMPAFTVEAIRDMPSAYVLEVKRLAKEVRPHELVLKPELVV